MASASAQHLANANHLDGWAGKLQRLAFTVYRVAQLLSSATFQVLCRDSEKISIEAAVSLADDSKGLEESQCAGVRLAQNQSVDLARRESVNNWSRRIPFWTQLE